MERDPSNPASQEQPGVSLNKPASFEPPVFGNTFTPPPAAAPTPAPASPGSAASADELNLATIAHGAGIVTSFTSFGFVPPLVLWQINKGVKPYAANEAIEALNFQLTVGLAMIVSWMLMLVLIGFVLLPLVWIWGLVMAIIATVKSSRGEPFSYPLTINFIRKE